MAQEMAENVGGSQDLGGHTQEWYRRYYGQKGQDRNDVLRNHEVLFQNLAYDISVIRALQTIVDRPETTQVLDVGCGGGGGVLTFLRLGFDPSHLHGVDILPERIEMARRRFPGSHFQVGDARHLPYPDQSFDLAFEGTMFVQITDETIAAEIAREIVRVVRPGGHILLADWRYSKPWNENYRGLTKKRVRSLFGEGVSTRLVRSENGALIPPVGRFLSKYFSAAYFPLQALCPTAVGQTTVVLKRI